jgi:drug/metabolite transporter (DMT)-like permease
VAALLALLASVLWGAADFLGGAVTRRLPLSVVLLVSQASGVAVLLVVLATRVDPTPPGAFLGWGLLAGFAGLGALACFYRALADGQMSVVAPIAATGVTVPVVVSLIAGERPGALTLAGIGLAVAGVVASAGLERGSGGGGGRSVPLALLAACGFGSVLIFLDRGSETSSLLTLVTARGTAVVVLTCVCLGTRTAPVVPRADRPAVVSLGLLDTGALALYGVASRSELVAVVAVLASLYPVVTVGLAAGVHHERLSRTQLAGVATALVGVLLIGAGSA